MQATATDRPRATASRQRVRRRVCGGAGLAFAACVVTATVAAQSADPAAMAPLAPLIGRWEGTTEGRPGKGTVQREYSRILGDRFVHVRNRSAYPVQERNPKGEVHEDVGIFSFDKVRKVIVLRQFHIEGFVNQYVQEATAAGDVLVFTSETIENIPAGWRARETYRRLGPDEIEEVFELAEPGKAFEVYSRSSLKRVE